MSSSVRERGPVVPRATYRVQLHPGFGFDAAAGIAPYLERLGISHFYASPYLQAAPGSTHGYDVVDPRQVNRELGGAVAHHRFCRTLGDHHLGQVLDVVPNHMAIGGPENPWWMDVLENGPSSRYSRYFDVDWDPPESRLRNLVLIPILGDHYGRVLEAGELRLERSVASFSIRYHEHRLPVAPRSLDALLARAAERAGSDELAFVGESMGRLPPSTATDRESVWRRHRDKEVLRTQLARLVVGRPDIARALDDEVARVNADHDAVHELLERQNYRLAYWRIAGRELDYRRFFDVTTLIGLRTEDELVFSDTHELLLRWLRDGVLDGLRIDHPDGLRDPAGYFQRLRRASPRAWIVAEKILEPGERLPADWPIAGTTGYDFLNRVGGLFVDPAAEKPLTDLYAAFTGEPTEFREVVYARKQQVLREVLAAEVNRLTALFLDVIGRHPRHRDHTRHDLHEALRQVAACFPVYRTYVRAETSEVAPSDREYVDEAIGQARVRRPDLAGDLLDFLRDVLLARVPGDAEAELAMRFQQLTGPAMAKGVEDTAFYTYNRLTSLNEVGGDPWRFGVAVADFHADNAETQARWPATMLTTSTHDTKRSEDVRSRISLLSEIPDRWSETVTRWSAHNERHRHVEWPDRNAEWLLYQTLVGAWPIGLDRLWPYMLKAAREAKTYTSWTDQRPEYEEALRSFVAACLADETFVPDLEQFVAPLVDAGRITSLAQTLLKLTSPGVPDVYQGTELWDLSLVDPDNRRPVDYAVRERLLDDARTASPEAALARMDEGLPKIWLIRRVLGVRARRPELFGASSAYQPLVARGERAGNVVAFARGGEAVTVAPRLVLGLAGDWRDTRLRLPGGCWEDELTGERVDGGDVPLARLLRRFPVALLLPAPL